MGWEWITKKCGLNFATSGYGPDVIYAWETAPMSSITRGTNPLSEDNLSLPFEKYWNLDDKLIAYFSCNATGQFTVTLTDISTTPNVQLCYINGVNLQTPCSIDLMMGIDQSQGSAFAVFLMTRAGVTSDFIVISTLGALGGNRNRLCNILNQIPDDAPTPTYTWQSVPSISGKNGILTLSTLNDINDGEPVETSDTSKFNLTDDSNVSALVAAHFSQ